VTNVELFLWVLRLDPQPGSGSSIVPSLPGLPNVPAAPAGVPSWLVIIGYVLAVLGTLGFGGIIVELLRRRQSNATAQRTEVEADEVFTRVAVTLVEPLRDRLAQTEQRLVEQERRHAEERAAWEAETSELRRKVREAISEADAAITQAHRVNLLAQKWHRAIMDPSATLEWLRQLVGPDEPAK